jgi:hypothetical protein
MDPRFSEFMGEMREFKRMSLESFEELKTEVKGLRAWKLKIAGGAMAMSALVTVILKWIELKQ